MPPLHTCQNTNTWRDGVFTIARTNTEKRKVNTTDGSRILNNNSNNQIGCTPILLRLTNNVR
ncbi:hypothetical protein PGB90_005172 [Kerria lacca]